MNPFAVVRLGGSVNPLLELKDRYLQLAPGYLSPFIRSRELVHDMSTLLCRFTFHPLVSPSAYPRDYQEALASDSILPCSPCGWHLLHVNDLSWRATTGFLRS